MRVLAGLTVVLPLLMSLSPRATADDDPRYVFTPTHAVVLGAPELASQGRVTRFEWSGDGRFVLCFREIDLLDPADLPASFNLTPHSRHESSVVLWDRRRRRPIEVWKRKGARLMELGWLPSSAVALVTEEEEPAPGQQAGQRILLRIDAGRAVATEVGALDTNIAFSVSPSLPVAALFTTSRAATRVSFVNANGPGRSVMLPGCPDYPVSRWSADGKLLYVGIATEPLTAGKRQPISWFQVDPITGASKPASTTPAAPIARPSRADLRLDFGAETVGRENSRTRIHPLWLETDGPAGTNRMLVFPDVSDAEIAPDGGSVLYVSGGSAYVAPLLARSKDAVLAALEARNARVCRANINAICSAEAAFALRNGHYTTDATAGGLVGSPEGLSEDVQCPAGGSYTFTFTDGALTISCPHGDHHAQFRGKPADYARTMAPIK
jgi:hypothetical protein